MNLRRATNVSEPRKSKTPGTSRLEMIAALFMITRPLNVAIAGLSILVAAVLAAPAATRPFHFTLPIVGAIVSGMLIAAGANVVNDCFDVEIDRINRPQRILPSGRLTLRTAQIMTIFLFACGNFFSIFINAIAAMIAIATSFLLFFYSWKLKRQPLSGNFAVSLATALAFIYGAMAAPAGDWRAGIFPALFAFLFHFGREVIKDIEDQVGDRALRARTLPLAYGVHAAQIAGTTAFALLCFLTVVPFYLGIYGATYLWIILLGVDPILIWAVYGLWKNPAPRYMRQISAALKTGMLVGLAAIYFG